MTKTVNKASLRAAVSAMPDSAQFHMLLGIDGDSDFPNGHVMQTHCYQGSKEELLALIDSHASDEATVLSRDAEFLALGRRHAVLAEDLAKTLAG